MGQPCGNRQAELFGLSLGQVVNLRRPLMHPAAAIGGKFFDALMRSALGQGNHRLRCRWCPNCCLSCTGRIARKRHFASDGRRIRIVAASGAVRQKNRNNANLFAPRDTNLKKTINFPVAAVQHTTGSLSNALALDVRNQRENHKICNRISKL
jgi:hypothetical protein